MSVGLRAGAGPFDVPAATWPVTGAFIVSPSVSRRIAAREGFVGGLVDAVPLAPDLVAHAVRSRRAGLIEIFGMRLAIGEGGRMAVVLHIGRRLLAREPEQRPEDADTENFSEPRRTAGRRHCVCHVCLQFERKSGGLKGQRGGGLKVAAAPHRLTNVALFVPACVADASVPAEKEAAVRRNEEIEAVAAVPVGP